MKATSLVIYLAAVLVTLAFSVWAYPHLPDQMPVQWSTSGSVIREVPRLLGVALVPALLLFILVAFRMRTAGGDDRMAGTYHAAEVSLAGLAVILAALHAAVLGIGLNMDIDILRLTVGLLGLLLVVLTNTLGKTRPNALIGLRLPWLMHNERAWNKVHRTVGRVLFCEGLLALALSLFGPGGADTLRVMTGVVLLSVVGLVLYSRRVAAQT